MNPTFQALNSIGNILNINNGFQFLSSTYLKRDETAGAVTINVDNNTDFPSTGLLLISVRDSENAEFVTYSAKPSVSTFTVAALTLSHSRGESVNQTLWNQFIIESSPDGSTWSSLATIAIDPTSTSTVYNHSAGTAGLYYRVAYRNSVTTLQSGFSSTIQAQTPAYNSAQALINEVIEETGVSTSDTIITQQFLFEQVNTARRLFDNLTHGYQWDWREKFNVPFKVLSGTNFINLPDDIDFDMTNRSILKARLNGYNQGPNYPMNYVDKSTWNDLTIIIQGSYSVGITLIGSTSLVVENSGDFADAGTIYIATDNFDQQILVISYTANDRITNTLSGISVSAITRDIPAGTQIWARTIGTIIPVNYTVFDGKLWFDNIMPDMMQGRNIYLDYYSKLQKLESPADVMPEHHAHIYKDYMKYAIEKRKDPSTPLTHPDYVSFANEAKAVMNNMYSGQTLRIRTS